MKNFGDFSFKASLFSYCERYLIPFDDLSYGQLPVHAPPICLLSLILLPYVFTPDTLRKVSVCYAMLMFWLENIFLTVLFIIFEIVCIICVYFKMIGSIIKSADRCVLRFVTILIWIPFGGLIMIGFMMIDLARLFKLLGKMNED